MKLRPFQKRFVEGVLDPGTLGKLRDDSGMDVMNICGVPSTLGTASSDGTAAREAWRRLLHGSLTGIARLIETDLRLRVDPDIKINLDAIRASDLSGRARAFQSLTRGGLLIEKAAALSGLLEDDE